MKLFTLTSAIAFSSLLGFASAETSPGQFYAYGKDIPGLPLFVGDGKVYIGNVSLSSISGAANLTFVESESEIVSRTFNDTSGSTNSTEYLAIDTASGASKPVLITTSNSTDGYTTSGYYMYGEQVTWLSLSRDIKSNFYAIGTGTDDLWELFWNADSPIPNAGTPVVVKNILPPSIGFTHRF